MLRVECHNVTVKYGSFFALKEINLEVPPGQYLALFGENGAGKSTLLRALAGWFRITQGTICINGLEWENYEREIRAHVKLVPDTPQFYPDMTVWEHLQLVTRANRIPQWESEAKDLLNSFGIDQNPRAYPASFSRGMQYKLALTMALITHPQVLLLDEPFGPLDPHSQSHLAKKIHGLVQGEVSVLLSTHVLPNNHPPDRAVVLDQGVFIEDSALDTSTDQVWSQLPHRVLQDSLHTARNPNDA